MKNERTNRSAQNVRHTQRATMNCLPNRECNTLPRNPQEGAQRTHNTRTRSKTRTRSADAKRYADAKREARSREQSARRRDGVRSTTRSAAVTCRVSRVTCGDMRSTARRRGCVRGVRVTRGVSRAGAPGLHAKHDAKRGGYVRGAGSCEARRGARGVTWVAWRAGWGGRAETREGREGAGDRGVR